MTIDVTLESRGKRYGEFVDHAKLTQGLKSVMSGHPDYVRLSDDKKEALEMIQHKIGRIINGDPEYVDSWTDIIGYARLVEKELVKKEPFQSGIRVELGGDEAEGMYGTQLQNSTLKESFYD